MQGDTEHAQDQQRGEHAGHVRDGLRLGDRDAHAALRAQELGDDGAQQRVDHRHVQAGEDERRGGRQLDQAVGLQAGC
jgi:hypothetical protein